MGTPLRCRSTRLRVTIRMISRVALLVPLIAAASAAPEARFSCEECVREMHGLAAMVKMGAIPIHDYIRDNYCPSLDSTAAQHFCEDSLSNYYVDGALHVCQTSGTCSAREYTCDECIQGLEWVEMYLEDPIMIAEFRIYLELNFCLSDWDDCKALVEEHFTGMHTMAMEKFFIPTEICMQEPVCGGSPTYPPKPTDGPDA